MSKTPFVIHEHVRWGDVDYAGIIRYDAYTRFMELAESELFRSIGIPQRAFTDRLGLAFPAGQCTLTSCPLPRSMSGSPW